jgi:hypothetical protein
MEARTITYGTLADFLFGLNVPATSPATADLLIAHVCSLHQKNLDNVSMSDLDRLKKSLSSFSHIFRKKYKAAAYNQNRLRQIDWFKLSFNFQFTHSLDDFDSKMSHEEPGVNRVSVPRRELFDRMRESKFPITDIKGQTDFLSSHLTASYNNFQWSEDQLLVLNKDLRFFVLEIRKRFLQQPIKQNYEKFIKKYSSKEDGFLNKKFHLPIECTPFVDDDESNNFDSTETNQKSEPQKVRLGMGRIPPTEFPPDENCTRPTTVKSDRRLGLSKLEKNVQSLHPSK